MAIILPIKRLITIGIITAVVFAHPFHVSITTFQLNRKTQSIEITMKLFTDDLEDAIREKGLSAIKLGSKNEYVKSDSLINQYINTHLVLLLDQNKVSYKWVGKEIENDIIWCYLEILKVGEFSTASITNSIFVANFTDQLNISHFYKEDQIETIMHHRGEISGTIHFLENQK